jgi:plasmid stability protein
MATISLKNVPEGLLSQLRAVATDERRSLNQQILHMLDAALNADFENLGLKAACEQQTAAWKRLAGRWESRESAKAEVARIYAARTEGRTVEL